MAMSIRSQLLFAPPPRNQNRLLPGCKSLPPYRSRRNLSASVRGILRPVTRAFQPLSGGQATPRQANWALLQPPRGDLPDSIRSSVIVTSSSVIVDHKLVLSASKFYEILKNLS